MKRAGTFRRASTLNRHSTSNFSQSTQDHVVNPSGNYESQKYSKIHRNQLTEIMKQRPRLYRIWRNFDTLTAILCVAAIIIGIFDVITSHYNIYSTNTTYFMTQPQIMNGIE